MLKMFGIANCDTVKKAKSFLEKNKMDYDFIDFKKVPPTKDQILLWSKYNGELPVNKKGTTQRKFKEIYESLDNAERIKFIIENNSMIKRPIFEKKSQVMAIGFNEIELKEYLLG